MGCAQGWAAQVEACMEQGHAPPPPNPADADDACPLRLPQPIDKTLPRASGPVAGAPSVHDARRLGETRHRLGNGCETRACSEFGLRARSRAVRWKNEGPT